MMCGEKKIVHSLGSLFDGIGGFPLAAVHNGIMPVWASEIEAFPIDVTKEWFPAMLHVGDITRLNGAELPPGPQRGRRPRRPCRSAVRPVYGTSSRCERNEGCG